MQLVPVLVVDPEKAESLTKWNELATIAASSTAKEPVPEFMGNVSTSADLLGEALWFLCRAGQNERLERRGCRREHCANRFDSL